MLAFLGRRVLGQYDPQLLGAEPIGGEGPVPGRTNVEEWQRHANLPDEDLRRWLILHEMTHAWQFAAHPWLRSYMEESMKVLIDSVTRKATLWRGSPHSRACCRPSGGSCGRCRGRCRWSRVTATWS